MCLMCHDIRPRVGWDEPSLTEGTLPPLALGCAVSGLRGILSHHLDPEVSLTAPTGRDFCPSLACCRVWDAQ